jgi:hypothetical protein
MGEWGVAAHPPLATPAAAQPDVREGESVMVGTHRDLAGDIEELLVEARIFDLCSYVWRNANEIDPEFEGLAAWELDPPWDLLRDDSQPTVLQRRLMVAGADFEGSLSAARLSIGLILLHEQSDAPREWHGQEFFWLHRIGVLALLKIAADHIRRYLVLSWRDCGLGGGKWEQAFLDIPRFVRAAKLTHEAIAHAEKLAESAPTLAAHAKDRDITVHELTTPSAFEMKSLLETWAPNTLSEAEQAERWERHYAEILEVVRAQGDQEKRRRAALLEGLRDWYALLVHTANHVFSLEHSRRAAKGPVQLAVDETMIRAHGWPGREAKDNEQNG